jgi:cytochrome c
MITEETFTAYIQDPTGFIQEATGDGSLRGAMAAQRMRGDTDAADLYAYLASLAE